MALNAAYTGEHVKLSLDSVRSIEQDSNDDPTILNRTTSIVIPPIAIPTSHDLPLSLKSEEYEGDTYTVTEDKKSIWSGQGNIIVAVRVRPLNRHERRTTNNVLRVLDNNVVVVLDPTEKRREKDILRMNRSREKHFAFDYAFGPNITTEKVYQKTTKLLIEGVINGFNATVFAYGATGAGKV